MEAKMEKIDVNVVKFEVKVEADKFKEALTRAYKLRNSMCQDSEKVKCQ